MASESEWTLLDHYDSQTEARVVESFLTAQGFDVKLLDTHTHGFAPVKGILDKGMRLIVRTEQAEAARQALRDSGSHLSVVGETPSKIERGAFEIVAIILALALAAAIFIFR